MHSRRDVGYFDWRTVRPNTTYPAHIFFMTTRMKAKIEPSQTPNQFSIILMHRGRVDELVCGRNLPVQPASGERHARYGQFYSPLMPRREQQIRHRLLMLCSEEKREVSRGSR